MEYLGCYLGCPYAEIEMTSIRTGPFHQPKSIQNKHFNVSVYLATENYFIHKSNL